jgi:hypothetical protein
LCAEVESPPTTLLCSEVGADESPPTPRRRCVWTCSSASSQERPKLSYPQKPVELIWFLCKAKQSVSLHSRRISFSAGSVLVVQFAAPNSRRMRPRATHASLKRVLCFEVKQRYQWQAWKVFESIVDVKESAKKLGPTWLVLFNQFVTGLKKHDLSSCATRRYAFWYPEFPLQTVQYLLKLIFQMPKRRSMLHTPIFSQTCSVQLA